MIETKDVKEESGNKAEFLRDGISYISYIRYKISESHATDLSAVVHVISE